MKIYSLLFMICLTGCNALDRLTNQQGSRNSSYDTTPSLPEVIRLEPFAIFAGYHPRGDGTYENLYLIYWKGNVLDNTSHLESEIDLLEIRKYNN